MLYSNIPNSKTVSNIIHFSNPKHCIFYSDSLCFRKITSIVKPILKHMWKTKLPWKLICTVKLLFVLYLSMVFWKTKICHWKRVSYYVKKDHLVKTHDYECRVCCSSIHTHTHTHTHFVLYMYTTRFRSSNVHPERETGVRACTRILWR